jgi:hypothetical protein
MCEWVYMDREYMDRDMTGHEEVREDLGQGHDRS